MNDERADGHFMTRNRREKKANETDRPRIASGMTAPSGRAAADPLTALPVFRARVFIRRLSL